MLEKKGDLLRSEMADSLEDPIGGEDASSNIIAEVADPEDNPLKDLKAEVLSVDWEITDKVMTRFIGEVNRLRGIYMHDRVLSVFLKLLDSIGKYVKGKKGKAHPDAIKLLNSVYNSLEKVVLLKGATEGERKRILSVEVDRFKKLKAEISQIKAKEASKRAVCFTDQAKPEGEEKDLALQKKTGPEDNATKEGLLQNEPIYQALFAALEEIKDFISGEFKALRAELKLWREEARKGL